MMPLDLARFETSVAAATRLLKAMAHHERLLVLCQLVDGERQVAQIATRLSQSALSQHLALLRAAGLVTTRRCGQAIFYRIADPAVHAVIATLAGVFCPPAEQETGHAADHCTF